MADKKVEPEETPEILTKPLPQILDEIESSIRLANEAARDARKSAEEARKAGEKAAGEAARAATEAISDVRRTAQNALELAELLHLAIKDAVAAIEKRLSAKQ
jgi:protein involved in temperature-dependent protein secretion